MDESQISAPDDRLPLVVTIGFTGHRAVDDRAAAEALIAKALDQVRSAFELIANGPYAAAYDGHARLRLLVGAAPGTDRIAAAVWRGAGFSGVHTIYPFREPETGDAFTDNPAKHDPETRIDRLPDPEPWTGIDAIGLGLEGSRAHGEVARWIVRHTEVLVAWWNGEQATATGGAGDTMRQALERGLPIVWLKPGEPVPRLVDPSGIHHHADAAEAMTALDKVATPLDPRALADLLELSLAPPGDDAPHSRDPEVLARRDYASVDPMRRQWAPLALAQWLSDRTLWKTYRWFEAVVGAQGPLREPSKPAPDVLAGQPGFKRLTAAASEAGARAGHLSAIHRSEQLLLIGIAILAVIVGASPAVAASLGLGQTHPLAALLEFGLGGSAFVIFFVARRAHRHRRWSDARRLAERLRAAVATWPLGFDIADTHAAPPPTWTEWRARAVLRAAGPPRGWIDLPRFEADVDWSTSRLIGSQVAYHGRQRLVADHIERFVQFVEAVTFGGLMMTLFVYLVLNAVLPRVPEGLTGLVTLVSAVSPAIGAGCLAMEATNGFGELALRSERLEAEFSDLLNHLGEIERPAYHSVLRVMRHAAQLLVEDADSWRDRLLRRRLVRGS